MNIALRKPHMTRDQFLDWAARQDGPYEFDGFAPVAMTGGSVNHSQIGQNIISALRARLRGSLCRPLGPDAGVATVGDRVRYPDALVTCAKFPGTVRLVPDVVVVFEVLSPGSGRIDRIEKVPEYRAVSSIRRYIIAEQDSAALQVLSRNAGGEDWTVTVLLAADTLDLPEIGISIPVAEMYEDVDLPDAAAEPSEAR